MTSYPRRSAARGSVAATLVVAFGLLLAMLTPMLGADAAAPPAPATQIVFTSVQTPSTTIQVPDTPGAPTSFIVKGVPFNVDVALRDANGSPAPLSSTKDVDVALRVSDAPGVIARVTVPSGATTATFKGITLPTAANGVQLTARSEPKKPAEAITGTSAAFDVLRDFVASPVARLTSIGSGGGLNASCDATPGEPVCADLLLDQARVTSANLLLSLGLCDQQVACRPGGSVVQVLVGLTDLNSGAPAATLVMKCDKSLCGGGGVPSFGLLVDLTYAGAPTTTAAPPCPDKGVLGSGQDFCVDYVQSTRSNAGDLFLYLLFDQDARVRFP
jgi:hypothetical protein